MIPANMLTEHLFSDREKVVHVIVKLKIISVFEIELWNYYIILCVRVYFIWGKYQQNPTVDK